MNSNDLDRRDARADCNIYRVDRHIECDTRQGMALLDAFRGRKSRSHVSHTICMTIHDERRGRGMTPMEHTDEIITAGMLCECVICA